MRIILNPFIGLPIYFIIYLLYHYLLPGFDLNYIEFILNMSYNLYIFIRDGPFSNIINFNNIYFISNFNFYEKS